MLRRLLLGYLGLLLVALAAFGVPFGILWASHARADALSALEQSAREAARAVLPPIAQAVHRIPAQTTVHPDPDRDSDGPLEQIRQFALSPAERHTLYEALSDFGAGARDLATVVRANGKVVAAIGSAATVAGGVLPRPALADTLGQDGQPTTGEAVVGHVSLLYAAVPILVPSADPSEPVAVPIHERTGIPVAAVVVGEPSGVLAGRVRTIAASLSALGAAILVLAALAGWLLVRSLVRPLEHIELAVADLGRGDLGARAPTDAGPPELVKLAETVNVMASQLSELISAQRAFVADASHQMRTPLTALRLRLEGLAADEPTPPDEVQAILTEVERLARLVTGLLRLARAEEQPAAPVATDVGALLAARGEAWRGVAEEQGVALAIDGEGPSYALVVAEDFEQAIDNLLDNALRVSPAGSTVRLSVDEETDGWLAVHVTDEGPGMAADDRQHAFDRFWTRRAERSGGSGLGLAIVARLVRNSGGEVELRDGPTGGGIDAVVRLRAA